jgi:hypothetical protein
MKELNLTEAFCEVFSGIGLLLCLVPLLDLTGISSLDNTFTAASKNITATNLAAVLFLCYALGTAIVDAIGLAIEEIEPRLFSPNIPMSDEEGFKFLAKVSDHVLRYRDLQWTYHSCYRNLLILLVPGTVLWTLVIYGRAGLWATLATLFGLVVVGAALRKSAITLGGLYLKITKHVGGN